MKTKLTKSKSTYPVELTIANLSLLLNSPYNKSFHIIASGNNPMYTTFRISNESALYNMINALGALLYSKAVVVAYSSVDLLDEYKESRKQIVMAIKLLSEHVLSHPEKIYT